MKEGDIIVGLNRYVLALVKTIDEDIDMDSLSELVNALNDTIANEIAIESHIGVGGVKSGLFNIRESFCESYNFV